MKVTSKPLVGVVMGSKSDWPQMKAAITMLKLLGVPYEKYVRSAHRTPDAMREYSMSARNRGLKVIIAGAGGAAHLPGMIRAWTRVLVIGVPIQSSFLNGLDSLLSIVQMPKGKPVATVGANSGGPANAGILAAQILAPFYPEIDVKLEAFELKETQDVLGNDDPEAAWNADEAMRVAGLAPAATIDTQQVIAALTEYIEQSGLVAISVDLPPRRAKSSKTSGKKGKK